MNHPPFDPTPHATTAHSLQVFKAEIFKALSHPTRIRVLEMLREREMSVSELSQALDLDISNVSQHLTVLRNKGILEGRKSGLTVYYQVTHQGLYEVLDLFRAWFGEYVESRRKMFEVLENSDSNRRA